MPPGSGELFRFPPARSFLLGADDPLWNVAPGPFRPALSLARGGLAVGWGANAVTWDEDDLRDFPFPARELAEPYRQAAARFEIAGPTRDDLSPFYPGLEPTQPPVRLGEHDRLLLAAYARRRRSIVRRRSIHLGRARLAVVTDPARDDACRYLARCLWGCPKGAIYDPARTTLRECERYPQFRYRPGRFVRFLEARGDRVTAIEFLDDAGASRTEPVEAVVLAAGAIQTGAILIRTLARDAGLAAGLPRPISTLSVLDTRMVKVPYVQLRAIGGADPEDGFLFNRLLAGHVVEGRGPWPRFVHGEILSLTSLLYHPLIESLPLGSRASSRLFFALKSAIGVVTWFLPDRPVPGRGLRLEADPASRIGDRLHVDWAEPPGLEDLVRSVVGDTRRALLDLGCLASPGGAITAPPGSGIHYGGTVPMRREPDPRACDPRGKSHAYSNLHVADGAAFPVLPSKSLTLTLAAHAIRVAEGLP